MEYVIDSIHTLEKLKQDKNLKLSVRKIKLQLKDFGDTALYEKRMNQYYFACGCQSGAVAVGLSFIFLIFNYSFSIFNFHWGMAVAIVFSAALIGKLLGLIFSMIGFESLYKKIYLKLLSDQYWLGKDNAFYARIIGGMV